MIAVKSLATTLLLSLSSGQAATSFVGTVDNDFNNASNWDNGLPTAGNDGTVAAPAVLAAGPSVSLDHKATAL